MLASEWANSDHVMSARASPHTVAALNAMPPSLLSSLATAHRFSSISRIFSTSALPSPHLKPPDDTSWTTQNSTADTTRARLVESPVNSDTVAVGFALGLECPIRALPDMPDATGQ